MADGKLRLWYAPSSPYVRKAHIALHETGLMKRTELRPVVISPLAPGDELPPLNPLGKIPTLEMADGSTMYDSRVICRYADDCAPAELKIYPAGDDLWPALSLEALADGVLDAALLIVYENRIREPDARHGAWVDGQWLKIERTLDHLEVAVGSFGNRVHMGHLACAVACGYIDFRLPDRDWRSTRPALAAWEKKIRARPSVADTVPKDFPRK